MTSKTILGIGIIGTGVIFDAYARGLGLSELGHVVAVADLDRDRAVAKAQQWGIESVGSSADLLADVDIDVIINITPPAAHAAISMEALRAGKHVYVEKPLAMTITEAQQVVSVAHQSARLIGSAPDTFLGQAGQTARWAVDAGLIGQVFAASSFVTSSKTETWHPSPAAFYAAGAGPALDLGPYHLAHLVNLLGPVTGVLGASSTPRHVLPVTSPGRTSNSIEVTTPSHTSAIALFGDVIVTTMYSFEVWDAGLPFIEIYGTEGTIRMPKPNRFDEPVLLRRHGDESFTEIAPVAPRTTPDPPTPFRALGVEDLIRSLDGEPHRTDGRLAIHLLEVLDTIATARPQDGLTIMQTTVGRPEALHSGQGAGVVGVKRCSATALDLAD